MSRHCAAKLLSHHEAGKHLGDEVVVGIDRRELREEREGIDLLNEEAQGGKHGKAAMLELSLTQNAQIEDVRKSLFGKSVSKSRNDLNLVKLSPAGRSQRLQPGCHRGWTGASGKEQTPRNHPASSGRTLPTQC